MTAAPQGNRSTARDPVGGVHGPAYMCCKASRMGRAGVIALRIWGALGVPSLPLGRGQTPRRRGGYALADQHGEITVISEDGNRVQ